MIAHERHEALLRRYMREVWDEGNPDAVEDFLDADYIRHVSPTKPPIGRVEQIDRLKSFRPAFPDISITVEDVIVSDDRVAFRSTMRGTHQGEFLGVDATGTRIKVNLLDVWRIANGKIVEQWGGPDMHDLMRQLDAH